MKPRRCKLVMLRCDMFPTEWNALYQEAMLNPEFAHVMNWED